jgi:uncharacterized protein (DUF2336 family)
VPTHQSKLADAEQVATANPSLERRDIVRFLADKLRPESTFDSTTDGVEFDRLLSAVISELATGVRVELAQHIAMSPVPFGETARRLALDEIAVARPVLEGSRALTEADLLEVIMQRSQQHMMAITRRYEISARISGALVERGEDNVVVSLLENTRAEIGEETYEKIATRAEDSVVLQKPLIRREQVPLDILNELYFKVEGDLRREILARNEGASTHDLSVALLKTRRRWLQKYGGLPQDYDATRAEIDGFHRRGQLKPFMLVRFLRERRHTSFKLALARLTETEYDVVNRIVERKDFEALAMIARAGGFDRALFVTIALMIAGNEKLTAAAEEYGALYESISAELAQRVMRFWKSGSDAEDGDQHGTAPGGS